MASGIPLRPSDGGLYPRMLDILGRLVALDTTSHRSNTELLDYVQELLAANGITGTLHWNEEHTKANLVATVGPSPDGERGIVWSAHTDVVPVEGQAWDTDPFALLLTDTAAVGRGTADMKGFIACCLAILTRVDHERLTTPVTLVLTYEEEVGCVGARRLVDELSSWEGKVQGCIVGEPTGMKVVVGHKGKQNHRISFRSEPKHAALAPLLPNPITAAAAVIGHAASLNETFRTEGPHDDRFDIGHSWINVGRIEGGVKPNIVPENCVVEFEVRNIPDHACGAIAEELARRATGEVLADMRTKSDSAGVLAEQLSDTPSFAIDPDHEFVGWVRDALGAKEDPEFVPFGTEAGLIWGHAGIPTVVCGPGAITEAHTANEFVTLAQLEQCLHFLRSLPLG
ncbi:acetylornithine deacetylase [Kitasatospora sp. NPDC056446]|uniref:acetylornithine deacetylase n=1 Tax=Kitasatospora sp. NPDC056446 TaxID=3345819 RepID=UPI0036B700C1